jgi:hypothetical protein
MGELGASCFNTLNSKTRDIEKAQWDEERFGMLCGTAAVFADNKRIILQLCQAYKKCVYDPTENTVSFYNGKKAKTITVVRFFNDIENFTLEVKKLNR